MFKLKNDREKEIDGRLLIYVSKKDFIQTDTARHSPRQFKKGRCARTAISAQTYVLHYIVIKIYATHFSNGNSYSCLRKFIV